MLSSVLAFSSFTTLAHIVDVFSVLVDLATRANHLYSCSKPYDSCVWLFNLQKYHPLLIELTHFALDSRCGLSRNPYVLVVFLIYLCQNFNILKLEGSYDS